jgi:hypothetical protein
MLALILRTKKSYGHIILMLLKATFDRWSSTKQEKTIQIFESLLFEVVEEYGCGFNAYLADTTEPRASVDSIFVLKRGKVG